MKQVLEAIYLSKDQNWQDETTIYWFELDGETWGVAHTANEDHKILDCDGCPVNTDDAPSVHLKQLFDEVTDEMIMDY